MAPFASVLLLMAASVAGAAVVDSEVHVMEMGVTDMTMRQGDGLMRRESMAGVSEHSSHDLPLGIQESSVETPPTPITYRDTNSDAYESAVMASNPAGYWSLGTSTEREDDPSLNKTAAQGRACGAVGGGSFGDPCHIDGKISGTPVLRNGLVPTNTRNQAMNFSGADDEEVVIPDSIYINTNTSGYTERTVELWFRSQAPGSSNRTLYCEGNEAHSGLSMYVQEDDSGNMKLSMFAWDRGNKDGEFGTALINKDPISCRIFKDRTYYAVMEFNSPNHSITGYIGTKAGLKLCGQIDDVPIGVILSHHGHGGGNAVIGGIHSSSRASGTVQLVANSNNFMGAVDEVAIYNRALPVGELQIHLHKGMESF